MKVCIASQGTDLESLVDPRFGRAAHLLVVDTGTGKVEDLGGAPGAAHGAGIQAAQAVLRAQSSAVVAAEVGPKAYEVLSAAEIPIYQAEGITIAQALRLLEAGMLPALKGPGGGRKKV